MTLINIMGDPDIISMSPVFQSVTKSIEFLRGHNLLLQDFYCCNQVCSKVHDISLSDKQIFQCNLCKKRFSIRTQSFWFKSKLALNVLLALLYFFTQGLNVTETKKLLQTRVSNQSIIQWFNYFRDICTCFFASNPVRFNNNSVVHIDETAIGGSRKYCRGRFKKNPRWLFGIIEKTTHKAFVQFVRKRDHLNLIPIITQRVPPGATINSNGAAVYHVLDQMRYIHNTVIHERFFVDPLTGTHTNWIEAFWYNLKYKFKNIRGSQGKMLDGHIDEFLYRYNRKNEGPMFQLLLNDIAIFYPI